MPSLLQGRYILPASVMKCKSSFEVHAGGCDRHEGSMYTASKKRELSSRDKIVMPMTRTLTDPQIWRLGLCRLQLSCSVLRDLRPFRGEQLSRSFIPSMGPIPCISKHTHRNQMSCWICGMWMKLRSEKASIGGAVVGTHCRIGCAFGCLADQNEHLDRTERSQVCY